MPSARWRDVVDALLFSVQFERELTDDLADRRAHALIEEPLHGLTPEQGYEAVSEALRSGEQLTGFLPTQIRHTEQDFREFLGRVRGRMDAVRPWPELPFLALDDSRWSEFTGGRAIARIGARLPEVQERLHRIFGSVEGQGRELRVLMLRLKSGDEVALVRPWWPNSQDFAVLQRPDSERSSQDVLAAFLDATGYTPGEVSAVSGPKNPNSLGAADQAGHLGRGNGARHRGDAGRHHPPGYDRGGPE